MNEKLNLTIIQADLCWEDKNKNISHFDDLINGISNTDIILLPEMFNTAFSHTATHLAETMNGETISWMKRKSIEKECDIAGSLMIEENGNVFNRLVWISKNGTIQKYDKRHLFSLIKEERYLTAGKERLIIELKGWRICPLICYDLRFPVFSRNDIDYDILIYLANWPIKRIDAWDTLLKARSIENQCFTVGVNRVGSDGNGALFNGHSKIFDAFGKKILSSIENKEQVLNISLDYDKIKLQRRQMNFLKDRDKFSID